MIYKSLAFLFFCIFVGTYANAASITFPVYGNWCGPGYPAEGENPITIDIIDEACKSHDTAYTECENNDNRLKCEANADLDLVKSLRDDVDKLSRIQLMVANNVGKYFSIQGPVKAISGKTKSLALDRYEVATELVNSSKNAFIDIGVTLVDIKDSFISIKDSFVDKYHNIIPSDNTKLESKED